VKPTRDPLEDEYPELKTMSREDRVVFMARQLAKNTPRQRAVARPLRRVP